MTNAELGVDAWFAGEIETKCCICLFEDLARYVADYVHCVLKIALENRVKRHLKRLQFDFFVRGIFDI